MPKLEIIIGDVKNASEEIARKVIADIKIASAEARSYNMACAKGNSALELYNALRKAPDPNFSIVTAFCIDEDLGSSSSYNFIKATLPGSVKNVEKINSEFLCLATKIDGNLFRNMLKNNPDGYMMRGREIFMRRSSSYNVNCLFDAIKNSCSSYENKILHAGGIDIAIMGLGADPLHIGSNFPPTYEDSITHLAEKTDKSGNVIGYAITMGIKTLCSAKKAVLFAFGDKKAAGVKEFLECEISENCPPSLLRNMDYLVAALDHAAASKLDFDKLKEIYKDRGTILRC